MRHLFLQLIVKLLLAFLAQATLSAARRHNGNGHFGFQRPHSGFTVDPLTTAETTTSSVISIPDSPPVETPVSTPDPPTPSLISTPDSQPVATPVSTPDPTDSALTDVVFPTSNTSSVSSGSPASSSGFITQSYAAPGAVFPPSASSNSDATTASDSPQSSADSTKSSNSRLLVEIVVPVVVATLFAAAIFASYRRRRAQDEKGWEGSRLPELDEKRGIWPFRRARSMSQRIRARDTYVGGDDWNRSDAHLRGEMEADVPPSGPVGPAHPEPRHPASEHRLSDPEPDFTRAFHSDSPSYDEPALAESRPASRIGVESTILPYDGPEVL
ncbi:hypothetical protein DFH07DRAFT_861557 [Mycena maculata]|uniref:Uncharacterized protein n=1 Tax=Mycena maculata TaxID=230809 RepID=A0AAD7MHG7_9AGAR|nr:hypothetical protein DFH07DRAFT_861557 [Mycena maculata]